MSAIGFTPSRKFIYKLFSQVLIAGSLASGLTMLIGSWIGGWVQGPDGAIAGKMTGLTLSLVWLGANLFLIHPYYRSLFFEIHEDEVVMHAGVITRSITHVPIQMITNLEIRRGPFDRLFKLGTINIQTAGSSEHTGATESLVGLSDFKEVYNRLTSAIKRTRNPSTQKVENPITNDHEMLRSLLEEMKSLRTILEDPNRHHKKNF